MLNAELKTEKSEIINQKNMYKTSSLAFSTPISVLVCIFSH